MERSVPAGRQDLAARDSWSRKRVPAIESEVAAWLDTPAACPVQCTLSPAGTLLQEGLDASMAALLAVEQVYKDRRASVDRELQQAKRQLLDQLLHALQAAAGDTCRHPTTVPSDIADLYSKAARPGSSGMLVPSDSPPWYE
jgi:hypothetical protein